MKRLLLFIFSLVVFCLAAVYILIPGEIKIMNVAFAPCIPKNVADCVRDQNALKRWWAGTAEKDYDYTITRPFSDGAEIQLHKGEKKIDTRLLVIPSAKDSSAAQWQTSFTSSYNPFKRIAQWFEARALRNNMHDAMDSLLSFAAKTENIYGFHIERTTFTDTILAATKFSTNTYPSIETIYRAVNQLKEEIEKGGAEEKDFPMVNVTKRDSGQFETMVAICVNKGIKTQGAIFISRMVPMKDRFLKTQVTGGPLSIKNAHKAVENYMTDHFLSAPAIPFEILITDRRRETDTSKWKTTIFHPSM